MNPVYLQICIALGNFLVTLLYVAWKKGQEDKERQVILKTQEDLEKDNKKLQDDVDQLSKDLNRLYGWLRAYTGSPLNGGTH